MAIIFAVSLVYPEGGIKAGKYTLSFPDYRRWFQTDTFEYKDIHGIITSVDTADYEIDTTLIVNRTVADTIPAVNDSVPGIPAEPPRIIQIDSISGYVYAFEYPDGNDTLLYPFFRTLTHPGRRNKPVRILHYGDSQIEADRITSTIRNYMQRHFGGQGIGFIPIVPATDASVTFQQDLSGHWKRFSVLDRKTDSLAGRRFGIDGSFTRYEGINVSDTFAYINLKPFYYGYRGTRTFSQARLFYGRTQAPFTITINQAETQRLYTNQVVSSSWWRFDKNQNALQIELHGNPLPDLYGISLDGENGVAMDNLAMRGSAGLDFTRMDTAQMGRMFRLMDVEMLILQFGANVVPNVRDDYDYYARSLTRQLQTLKALKENLTIIVIGVNDVSQNTPEGYRSYPNVAKIRDAQKQAAFNAGCTFWDLYEAMGGENSMPSWVAADPPLAQKDYVHFSTAGAKVVAELFCKAWTKEYRKMTSRYK